MKLRQGQTQHGLNWTIIILAFALVAIISVGGTLWGTGALSFSFESPLAERSAASAPEVALVPPAQLEQPAPPVPAYSQQKGTVPSFNIRSYASSPSPLSQAQQNQYHSFIEPATGLVSMGIVAEVQNRYGNNPNASQLISQNGALWVALNGEHINVNSYVPVDVIQRQAPQGMETDVVFQIQGTEQRGWAPKTFSHLVTVRFVGQQPVSITW